MPLPGYKTPEQRAFENTLEKMLDAIAALTVTLRDPQMAVRVTRLRFKLIGVLPDAEIEKVLDGLKWPESAA